MQPRAHLLQGRGRRKECARTSGPLATDRCLPDVAEAGGEGCLRLQLNSQRCLQRKLCGSWCDPDNGDGAPGGVTVVQEGCEQGGVGPADATHHVAAGLVVQDYDGIRVPWVVTFQEQADGFADPHAYIVWVVVVSAGDEELDGQALKRRHCWRT